MKKKILSILELNLAKKIFFFFGFRRKSFEITTLQFDLLTISGNPPEIVILAENPVNLKVSVFCTNSVHLNQKMLNYFFLSFDLSFKKYFTEKKSDKILGFKKFQTSQRKKSPY